MQTIQYDSNRAIGLQLRLANQKIGHQHPRQDVCIYFTQHVFHPLMTKTGQVFISFFDGTMETSDQNITPFTHFAIRLETGPIKLIKTYPVRPGEFSLEDLDAKVRQIDNPHSHCIVM